MSSKQPRTIRIMPPSTWDFPNFREVWEKRELLFVMMEAAIRSRYRQSILGLTWAVVHPLTYMMVFTLIFGQLAQIKTGELPYQIYAFAGLLPWQFISRLISDSTTSLTSTASILSKIYIPRVIVLLTPVASAALDFLIGIGVLSLMMIWFGHFFSWQIVFLPFFVLLSASLSISIGLWISVINVTYRDVSAVLALALQVIFYCSPIAYPIASAPSGLKLILTLNPITPIIEGYRFCFLGGAFPSPTMLLYSAAIILIIGAPGLIVFNRLSQTMIDRV